MIAFLLGFGGFQKTLENREEAQKPRVSSTDVLQKLTPIDPGVAAPEFDTPPDFASDPADDNPLGLVRAKSREDSQSHAGIADF